jgi:hypothetical protein
MFLPDSQLRAIPLGPNRAGAAGGGRDGRTRTGGPARRSRDCDGDAEDWQSVFTRVWPQMDALYRSFPGDGLLIAAVWAGGDLEAYLHIPLDSRLDVDRKGGEAPAFVVIGRHTACDLRLGQDDSISLRHLVVTARRNGSDVNVRLLDLDTRKGIVTEDGQRCLGLAADGAAFVTVGDYKLFILPTGSLAPLAWGSTAADAWATIPERIYVDRRTAASSPDQAPRVRLLAPVNRRSVATLILDPPTGLLQSRPSPGARGAQVGRLELRAGDAAESYPVHAADLARGLLIGRYDRCALGAEDLRLSRVHLLLVRDGTICWAVDTASGNGTTASGDRIRQLALGDSKRLCLGHAIDVIWTAVSAEPPAEPAAES